MADNIITYADFKNIELAKGERCDLIGGELYRKPALPEYHQSILDKLYRQITEFFENKTVKAFSAPVNIRILYKEDDSDDTVLMPDIAVFCDPKDCSPQVCRGTPDFIAEIITPTVSASELEMKIQLYHQSGVREYWVIDPGRKILNIYNFWDDIIFPKYYNDKDFAVIGVSEDFKIFLEPLFAE